MYEIWIFIFQFLFFLYHHHRSSRLDNLRATHYEFQSRPRPFTDLVPFFPPSGFSFGGESPYRLIYVSVPVIISENEKPPGRWDEFTCFTFLLGLFGVFFFNRPLRTRFLPLLRHSVNEHRKTCFSYDTFVSCTELLLPTDRAIIFQHTCRDMSVEWMKVADCSRWRKKK